MPDLEAMQQEARRRVAEMERRNRTYLRRNVPRREDFWSRPQRSPAPLPAQPASAPVPPVSTPATAFTEDNTMATSTIPAQTVSPSYPAYNQAQAQPAPYSEQPTYEPHFSQRRTPPAYQGPPASYPTGPPVGNRTPSSGAAPARSANYAPQPENTAQRQQSRPQQNNNNQANYRNPLAMLFGNMGISRPVPPRTQQEPYTTFRPPPFPSPDNSPPPSAQSPPPVEPPEASPPKKGILGGLLDNILPGIKLDEDRALIILLLIMLARSGADMKLLLALGYILM